MNAGLNFFAPRGLSDNRTQGRKMPPRNYKEVIQELIEKSRESDPIMEELMYLVYQGQFPLMEPQNEDDEELFFRNQSWSQSEWVMHASDLIHNIPYSRPSILQEIYDNHKVEHWTNYDDFSFYQYVGLYEGKKIRVIFYNSVNPKDYNTKIPYSDWVLRERSYIRICLD